MFRYCLQFLMALLLLSVCVDVYPQVVRVVGNIDVKGNLIGTKGKEIKRKTFYLFPGGIEANKALIDKLKTTEITSGCFYCQIHASSELIAWLAADNCESPYCREITTTDIAKVPEFQAAYVKGMKQFPGRPALAQKWLTTNLDTNILDGFLQRRKSLIASLIGITKPLQSAVMDSGAMARFVDIPLKAEETEETFLISNLLPIAVGDKSVIWACEVGISSDANDLLSLKIPVSDKPISKCEVIVRDRQVCTAGTCGKK